MLAMPAEASVNAFWKELGGSATGKAVSQLTPPPGLGNGVAVAAGADGKPIVVYTVSPISEDGTLLAKRWTGTAWQLISPVTGINDPSIGGENPQIVISPAGTIFVGWNTREAGGGQIHLRRRTATGTVWEQLAGSDGPGGLTSLNGSNLSNFSLAVGDDDLPVVAFEAPARKAGLGGLSTEVSTGSAQVYVKKYMGAAQAWQYLGPDPFGTGNTSAGGASGALSFIVAGGIYASHAAVNPSLTIDSAGRPTVAFIYQTAYFTPPGPPEFVAGNTEIFVTRFDNGAWGPVGPAVPTGDTLAGRGGAGGVSNNTGFSGEPSLAAASNGMLWMAWRESQPVLAGAIFVRRWNGVDTWEEVGGASASGGGINGGDGGYGPLVGLDQDDLPIVAWQDLSSKHVAFVLRFDGTEWQEMGPDSASDDGVTGDSLYRLALGASSGSPSTVNVAWLGAPSGATAQARLRQFFNGPSFLLSVGIIPGGSGQVTSSPIGINCPADSCSEFYPTGTVVSLAPTPGPDTLRQVDGCLHRQPGLPRHHGRRARRERELRQRGDPRRGEDRPGHGDGHRDRLRRRLRAEVQERDGGDPHRNHAARHDLRRLGRRVPLPRDQHDLPAHDPEQHVGLRLVPPARLRTERGGRHSAGHRRAGRRREYRRLRRWR
jgi:hypothetical protein